jgi:hypothetical protein
MKYTDQIFEELEELGFSGMVANLEEERLNADGGIDIDIMKYYLDDLERARVESTEEELPEHVYLRARELLGELFGVVSETVVRLTVGNLRKIIREAIMNKTRP